MDEEEKVKFGAESTVTHDGDVTKSTRLERHNGGDMRHLSIREESIRIDDKKQVLEKVMDGFGKFLRGEIVGFSVDATIYEPKTLQTKRILVKTIKLLPKAL